MSDCLGKINRPDTPYLKGVHIAGNYQDLVLKKALWMLKYQGVKQLAKPFGGAYQGKDMEKIGNGRLADHSYPLVKKKLRKRGHNQAELIAKELSGDICADVLFKKFHTKSQVEVKDKEERLANLAGSFGITKPEIIRGKKIILIDDVRTTGATMSEAKKVLKLAGAKKSWA